jgi:hypothetical protein
VVWCGIVRFGGKGSGVLAQRGVVSVMPVARSCFCNVCFGAVDAACVVYVMAWFCGVG